MKQKTITLVGYVVRGEALINLWGGGNGSITMDSTFIPLNRFNVSSMLGAVNDGQFGCESIESARVDLYSRWDNGSEEYERSIEIDHPIHTTRLQERRGIAGKREALYQ